MGHFSDQYFILNVIHAHGFLKKSTQSREENNIKSKITPFPSYFSQIININPFFFPSHFCYVFQYDFIKCLPLFFHLSIHNGLHFMLGHREPPHSCNCRTDVPYIYDLHNYCFTYGNLGDSLSLSHTHTCAHTHTHRPMLQ